MRKVDFDVLVVGGGHAGVEAVYAASKLGLKVALLSPDLSKIAAMSCNPSIGGLAKGHMVREVDVLGGLMGKAADASCIQFKRLNSTRGPAVRGTRMQCDKDVYGQFVYQKLSQIQNLVMISASVDSLLLEGNTCVGVALSDGSEIKSRSVVLTTGTFLNAKMFVGMEFTEGGRIGERVQSHISDQLKAYGFDIRRLKTGTPARLDRKSIDFSKTVPQWGDDAIYPFHFLNDHRPLPLEQIACYLSQTSEKTHDIINKNIHLSPLFSGGIEGIGPRYCPSIEDKVVRFRDRLSHQTFLEPETSHGDSIYLQGMSTSLPASVQDEFLRTIPGLERVNVLKYGYAVEYDFILPTQVEHSLKCKSLDGLFLAGQINGTSGYEEAAFQGLIAGINAARSVLGQEFFYLMRHEAYGAVLIDDLVTKGTEEPYRMFTSRAEHRLVLREDNTLERLYKHSKYLGLLKSHELDHLENWLRSKSSHLHELSQRRVTPTESVNELLRSIGTGPIVKPTTLKELLRRPEMRFADLVDFGASPIENSRLAEAVEIEVQYEGYISRQNELIEKSLSLESAEIHPQMDYSKVYGLSVEEREKLSKSRPRTFGQASRISGVNPSAIQAIMLHHKSWDPSALGEKRV